MKNFKLALATVLSFLILVISPVPAQAGTDLTVSCTSSAAGCSISPSSTPVFDEINILPGDSFQQTITAQNTSSQAGTFAVESLNLNNTTNGTVQLSDAITIVIREGSAVGPVLVGPISLTEFINPDPEYYLLSSVNPGESKEYVVQAQFDITAGNEYQGLASVFDLRLGFEFVPIVIDGGGSSGGSGSSGGNSGGNSNTTPQPPVCTAIAPTQSTTVTITNVGVNTVSLSWSAVTPITHYGITFTRTADGAQYGSPNIGNTTSYTVTNLSGGGANYSFQVYGVNDCAPGPFSGTALAANVGGPVILAQPTGSDGDVLGVEDEVESPSQDILGETTTTGAVAGATDQCAAWKWYIPWILLVAQVALVFGVEIYFRKQRSMTKHFITIGITLASIAIFYLVRDCNCYAGWWLFAMLCKWYWLVSILLSLFVRGVSYGFIEEVNSSETKPKTQTTTSMSPTKSE